MKPIRIQRRRKKGWRLPENTICVTRGTDFGNPFKVGGWFKFGDPRPDYQGPFGMIYCRSYEENPDPAVYTCIKDAATAVEWYEKLMCLDRYKKKLAELRGKNLACFCKIGSPCHADVLLKLANP
jgi:hypothetical protein